MLKVDDFNASYGTAIAVENLCFAIPSGQVCGLMGRNGAGKSTTIRAIIGLHSAMGHNVTGTIYWQGQPLQHMPMHQRAQLGLGYVPEDRRIFAKLSIADNLRVAIRDPARMAQRLTYVYALFPELYDIRQRMAGLLSGGQQQMLCIGRTLMGEPELLLLDEPSEGLAPLLVERIATALSALKRDGLSMLIAEQNVSLCESLCDRFILMQQGKTQAVLTADEVHKNPERLTHFLHL